MGLSYKLLNTIKRRDILSYYIALSNELCKTKTKAIAIINYRKRKQLN